jgi:lipopolysaccharide transport system permease protein
MPLVSHLDLSRGSAESSTVHIQAPHGLQLGNWRETLAHRELLVSFVRRDLTLRYRQTLLGAVWVILQPLLAASVLALVFSTVAKLPSGGHSYLLITLTGSVCWTTFAGALLRTSNCLVGSSQLISKVYFPRLILPLSAGLGALVDATGGLALLLVAAVALGESPGYAWLLIPLCVALSALLALGPGLALSSAMVRYRDIGYMVPVVIQLGLYVTPVGYLASAVPGSARLLVTLNPLAVPIGVLRRAILHTPWPTTAAGVTLVVWLVGGMLFGLLVFQRAEARLADVI